jgi:hypothetical protein
MLLKARTARSVRVRIGAEVWQGCSFPEVCFLSDRHCERYGASVRLGGVSPKNSPNTKKILLGAATCRDSSGWKFTTAVTLATTYKEGEDARI